MSHGGERTGAGRPPIDPKLKKVQIGIALPRWLIKDLGKLPDSKAISVEKAVIDFYGFKSPDTR